MVPCVVGMDRLETSSAGTLRFDHGEGGWPKGRGLKLLQLIRLLWASVSVRRVIQRESIDAVFTTGGYIAAPAILAARWCGIPVVHESSHPRTRHASAGTPLQCRRHWSSRCLKRIPEAVPSSRAPRRAAFLTPQPLPAWVLGDGPLLVVMGEVGAPLGSIMVRPIRPTSWIRMPVVHLTGGNDPEINKLRHHNLAERPFSDDIPGLLNMPTWPLPSGAGSLSELLFAGLPACWCPSPAADHHQDANAAVQHRSGLP